MKQLLADLGLGADNSGTFAGEWLKSGPASIESRSPVDGSVLGRVAVTTSEQYDQVILRSIDAFNKWRDVPAPKRGEILRAVGDELRRNKSQLGRLVTLEMGKILVEAEGEIQEIIDVVDYAV